MYEWLSADDSLVWTHVIRGVNPIGERRKNLWDPSWGGKRVVRGFLLHERTPNAQKWNHCCDQRDSLARRRTRHLRRGPLLIESKLDLHGLCQTQAHVALCRFVDAAWKSGLRSVLVITGKGTRTEGGVGVLRSAVPLWLNEASLQSKVLSFSDAHPRDGGDGALYLLIRRRRINLSMT